jgi:hypothetical protein
MAGNINWVAEHIESRVVRGAQWREQIEEHARLAKAFRYVRILGNGFRPVSISGVNPCGRLVEDGSGKEIERCDSLADAIGKACSAKPTEERPGKDKPEHRVQAFLIRAALLNNLRLEQLFPNFGDAFDKLIFVGDELAVKDDQGELRADMIAVGQKDDGPYFPVFIELKNDRQLTTLKGQLNNACERLWKNDGARTAFARFLSAVSGVPVNPDPLVDARRMLIWPKSPSGSEAASVQAARDEGFIVADFEPVYLFSHNGA